MHLSQCLLRVYCSSDVGSHSYPKQRARGLRRGLWGAGGGGPWKAATPQPLSLAIAGAPYGACVCARYLGGRIPTPESGKAQGARGGAGEWDGRRVGCKGDGSLLLKCLPKKKGPKETPWLVLTAAFWAFLTNFPAPSPYTQLTALEELVVI